MTTIIRCDNAPCDHTMNPRYPNIRRVGEEWLTLDLRLGIKDFCSSECLAAYVAPVPIKHPVLVGGRVSIGVDGTTAIVGRIEESRGQKS